MDLIGVLISHKLGDGLISRRLKVEIDAWGIYFCERIIDQELKTSKYFTNIVYNGIEQSSSSLLNGNTLNKNGLGTLAINNSVLTGGGTLNCAEGTCGGTGTISGDLNNEGGTISLGNSPGGLSSEGPVVPEPATWMLLAIGCAGCLGFRRRRPS